MSILTDEELINYLNSVDTSETSLTGRVLMQLGLISDNIFKETITALARNVITINQIAELHSIDDQNVSFLLSSTNPDINKVEAKLDFLNINGFGDYIRVNLAEFHIYAATTMNPSNSLLVYPNIRNSMTHNDSGFFFESFYNVKQIYLSVLQSGGFSNLNQAKVTYNASLVSLASNPKLVNIVNKLNVELQKLEQDPYFIYRSSFNFDNIFGVDSYIGFVYRGLYKKNLTSPGMVRTFLLDMFNDSAVNNAPSVDAFLARNASHQFPLFNTNKGLKYLKELILLKTILNPFYTRFNIPSATRIQIVEDVDTYNLLVTHLDKMKLVLDAYKLLSERIAYGELSW